jgi:hypothetical protein
MPCLNRLFDLNTCLDLVRTDAVTFGNAPQLLKFGLDIALQ